MNPSEESQRKLKHQANLYQQAGVDTDKAEHLVSWLQELQPQKVQSKKPQDEILSEKRPLPHPSPWGETVAGIGGFAALFRPHFHTMVDPLLVSSTDGVGTKVLLALEFDQLDGIGIDLVGMCANDLLTVGAYPLFFLDYFATGQLNENQFKEVLTGIHTGLSQCGASLLGGETAEMPGLYRQGHFDLAGFMVGVVDRPALLGREKVKEGDILIALGASGFHSNGYSLIRSWLAKEQNSALDQQLRQHLLTPTKIYGQLPALHEQFGEALHALAHITGGGMLANLARVIPDQLTAEIEWAKVKTPAWMQAFITKHTPTLIDTLPVFNLGVGMIACLDESKAVDFIKASQKLGLDSYDLGQVTARKADQEKAVIRL